MTPEEAETKACPIGRCFTTPRSSCAAGACILWRWQPVTTADPRWRAAMAARMAETGEKAPGKEAAAWVVANAGLEPITGWCGLGGKPE